MNCEYMGLQESSWRGSDSPSSQGLGLGKHQGRAESCWWKELEAIEEIFHCELGHQMPLSPGFWRLPIQGMARLLFQTHLNYINNRAHSLMSSQL